jgi:hypothetical protein
MIFYIFLRKALPQPGEQSISIPPYYSTMDDSLAADEKNVVSNTGAKKKIE